MILNWQLVSELLVCSCQDMVSGLDGLAHLLLVIMLGLVFGKPNLVAVLIWIKFCDSYDYSLIKLWILFGSERYIMFYLEIYLVRICFYYNNLLHIGW